MLAACTGRARLPAPPASLRGLSRADRDGAGGVNAWTSARRLIEAVQRHLAGTAGGAAAAARCADLFRDNVMFDSLPSREKLTGFFDFSS